MSQSRIFYSILQRIGGQGNYQHLSLLFWSLIILQGGSSSFFNAFLFYQESYHCPFELRCHQYVCSLPESQRTAYVNPSFTSLASKFGDYRCHKNGELNKLQSFIYVGGMIGVIFGAVFSKLMTKKKLMILVGVVNLIGIIITIFGSTILMASFGLFINYAANCIKIQIIVCYITEAVSQQLRGRHSTVIFTAYALGVTLNGLFFKLIKQWELVLVIYNMFPLLIGLLGLIFYIEQTPFDLIINQPSEKSLAILESIARRNGNQDTHMLTLQQVSDIQVQYYRNKNQKHKYKLSIFDFFRFDSLRIIFIMSIFLHFFTQFQFGAPELALENYSLDIYLNGICIGFSEVLACILCYFIVDHYERKKVIYITEVISLCIAASIFVFFSCEKQAQCSIDMQVIQTIGLFFFRFFITIAYNFFYMIQYEAFPNQVRALGLQIVSIANYIAIIFVPQIMGFFQHMGVSIIITFAVSCVFVFICMLKMPQTFGTPPPEMIKELQYVHVHDHHQMKK